MKDVDMLFNKPQEAKGKRWKVKAVPNSKGIDLVAVDEIIGEIQSYLAGLHADTGLVAFDGAKDALEEGGYDSMLYGEIWEDDGILKLGVQ